MKFREKIIPDLIKNHNLSKEQAKKLICIFTLADGYASLKRLEWTLKTSPEPELHNLIFDLFRYSFGIKMPIFYESRNKYCISGFYGSKYSFILKDLFSFTPTFKTSPAKRLKENFEKYFSESRPTISFLFDEPKWFQRIALRLISDLEGSISPCFCIKYKTYKRKKYYQFQFDPALQVSITNPILASQWQKIGRNVGIRFFILKDIRRWSRKGGLSTRNRKEIMKFLKIGGFLSSVRIHKSASWRFVNNNSYSKQTILKTCCDLLQNNKCSVYFSSKQDALKYRKFFIRSYYIPCREKFENEMGPPGFEPGTIRA